MHAFTGIGFLVATFIVRPFLPEADSAERTREDVCGGGRNSEAAPSAEQEQDGGEKYVAEYLAGVPKVAWPFLITGVWCILVSCIYVLLGCLPWEMPRYYESGEGEARVKVAQGSRIKHWRIVIVAVGVYYALSCGIERIYQPMVII